MFALEIINALNDPGNPAELKGLNAKLSLIPNDEHPEDEDQASAALDRREERNILYYSSGNLNSGER